MRLVFDVTPLSVPRSGIGNYLRGALAGILEEAAGTHEVVAFALTDREGAGWIDRSLRGLPLERRVLTRAPANVWRRTWTVLGRPALERVIGPFDAYHLSDWWHPPQEAGVRAATIHDLVPIHHPEWTSARTRIGHRWAAAHIASACDVVFVNSDYTGRDVVATLGVPGERIRVALPGVDERFRPDGPQADLGHPYVLTVATLEPRKNLEALLAARPLLPPDLVIAVVGGRGWGDVPELAQPGLRLLGYVDDGALPELYRGASAFVYPSRFEGFGMPIVEAMACGVPVVASSHPSLDEASGPAALRASPDDPAAIAARIEEAVADPAPLVARGLDHARSFTWRGTGRVFLDALTQAATAR